MGFFKKFASLIVGVAAGFLFGPGAFSLTAFSVGQIVGGLLFNRPKGERPELGEIQQPKSQYDSFIPIVHGGDYQLGDETIAGGVGNVAGQFMDCDPAGGVNVAYREKGLVPSLHFSGALLWCEAVGSPKEIVKIWFNEVVAYDATGADDAARGFVMETDEETGVSAGHRTSNNKTKLWNYPGNRLQLPNSYLVSVHGEHEVPAYHDCCYSVIRYWPQDDNGGGLPTAKALIKDGITGVEELVEAWALRVEGFPQDVLDLSALTGDVQGQFMASQGSPKDKIEELANFKFCDIVDVDGHIKAVDRRNPTVWELTEIELGAAAWNAGGRDDSAPPKLAIEVGQPADLASSLKVSFLDPAKNWDKNTANAIGAPSQFLNPKSIDLTIVAGLDEMTQWAQPAYDETVAAKDNYKLSLMPSRLAVGPGDELRVPTPTGVRSMRVVEQAQATVLGVISTDCVSFDREVYDNHRKTASTPRPSPTPTKNAAPLAFVWDSVATDATSLTTSGVLVAASQPADTIWETVMASIASSGGLMPSFDFRSITAPAVMGETAETFALGNRHRYDAARELDVTMLRGQLQSTLLARQGANLLALETGRLISFTTATAPVSGAQTISGIRDARYGSDFDSATIPAGTRFVLLTDHTNAVAPGTAWLPLSKFATGSSVTLEFLNTGPDELITTRTFIFRANSLRPPAPVNVRLTRDEGDAILRGRARTRIREDGAWTSANAGTQADHLDFRITLSDGATTVTQLRTAFDPSFEFTWTADELTSLFGSLPDTLTGTIEQEATNLTNLVFIPNQWGHARAFTQE